MDKIIAIKKKSHKIVNTSLTQTEEEGEHDDPSSFFLFEEGDSPPPPVSIVAPRDFLLNTLRRRFNFHGQSGTSSVAASSSTATVSSESARSQPIPIPSMNQGKSSQLNGHENSGRYQGPASQPIIGHTAFVPSWNKGIPYSFGSPFSAPYLSMMGMFLPETEGDKKSKDKDKETATATAKK